MDGILSPTWPFHRLPVPVFQIDAGGLICHANRHLLNLLCLDADDVIGKPLVSFMPDDARDQHLQIVQAARDEVCEIESQFLTGDGTVTDIQLSYTVDRDKAGAKTGFLGTVVDLTVRRALQHEVASNVALLESVVTHANDGVLITEADPINAPDGPRILYINPAFSAMSGYSLAEICGKTPRILQGPKTDRRELDRLRDALKAWKPVRAELVNYAKNGAEFHIEVDISPVARPDGSFTHWVAIQRNITERREQAEQSLRTLVETMPQLMWRATGEGKCSWTNPQWSDLTGQSPEESREDGWAEVVKPEDRVGVIKAWRAARRDGQFDTECRLRRQSDGAYLWYRTQATAVRDRDGQILEWVGTCTDIQDFKDMQQQQEVLLAELQHRTRNLLAVVQAISGKTLRRSGSLQEFATKYDSRLSALSRMQGLLARTNKNTLDLKQLVELELDCHVGLDPAKIQIAGPTVRIGAASGRTIVLALHELAANAVKYGALGQAAGTLAIGWAVGDEGGKRQLAFEWCESGVVMPPRADIDRPGFGREILEHALPYELDARTQFQFGPEGVRCSILIPLAPGRSKHG